MNRTCALLVVCSAVALPAAATDNVCWNRDTERMDFYTNPPSRGDNNFFSFTVSGTANVTMIYPGTASMNRLPVSLYELRGGADASGTASVATPFDLTVAKGSGYGCSNSYLNNLTYFILPTSDPPAAAASCGGKYDYTKQYPEPEQAYAGGGGLADNFELGAGTAPTCPAIVNPNYLTSKTDKGGGLAWQFGLWPANNAGTTTGLNGSIDDNCQAAIGATYATTNATDYSDCQLCVRTKGYWLNYLIASKVDNSAAALVAKGNWLNFYPPKWAILRTAYKRLVNGPLLNPLREGIGTQNGATGWYRLQKMLPQSCSGAGRPNQRISSTDSVTYTNTSNPLAEMLFNVAWTVSSQGSSPPSSWGFFTNASTHPASEPGGSSDANKKAGFCPGCNAGFSVLFSDGRGIDGWQTCDSSQYIPGTFLTTAPGYCRNADGTIHDSASACSGSTVTGNAGLGLGSELDGDDFLNPNLAGGATSISQSTGKYYGSYSGVCPNDWLANVAAWMFATDLAGNSTTLDVPGTNLRLYTVGIGDNYNGELNTLKAAAGAGHGLFLSAANFTDLERNISKVFLDILSNATSFSVAAITTVQTRGTTFAFIPRFRPLGGSQWEGRLYRFRLYNEFAAGCGPTELTGGPDGGPLKDSLNPNGNASCNDLYLQDADGGFVGEDDGGTFILLDSTQAYTSTGFPAKSPKTAANPIWEAASLLTSRETSVLTGTAGATRRMILTASMDGGVPSPGSALVQFNDFSAGNIARMTDYMKLSGVNSSFCAGLASTTRHVYASEQDCGQDLMKFIDGQDVLRQNTDGGLARPLILGDIFHSSPILVTPPAPPQLCDLGIINQCLRTLYAQDSSGTYTPDGGGAYDSYRSTNGARQQLILVGANDGMLHAFQAGTATVAGDGGVSYDDGTGQEVWAVIPPDLLPKLQRYALSESHNILLDGSPWVRDIWKDGSGSSTADRVKQPDEFHTVAIVGEREGGRHYTALDVTDTSSNPRFLWTWPPPGSNYELAQGESWNDTTPSPPSIGPILMADTLGPINKGGTKASERWVVALSGGYDPNMIRGRAIYILDAWDGTLLFKFSRYDTNSSADPNYNLGSVAAPTGFVDSDGDNFFDMAIAGDVDGQIWTIDMLNPGTLSAGLVNNWFGGLTFQQFKGGAISQRAPFFPLVATRIFSKAAGGPRIYVGSGDRDQIKVRDTDAADGGTCTQDNLRGCVRNNCTVDVNQATYQIGSGAGVESLTGEWKYTASGPALTTNIFALNANTQTAGACSDPAQVGLQYTVSCGTTTWPNPDGGASLSTISNTMNCDFDGGTDAGEECLDTSGKSLDQPGIPFTSPAITNTRFYSVRPFDYPALANRPRMVDTASQTTYNQHTLTDTDLVNADDGGVLTVSGAGWFVQHARDANEKTASGALLLGGCVAWNTEVPSVLFQGTGADGGQTCAGGTIPADTAYLYQANDDTGAIACGLPGSATYDAGVRYQSRLVTVTPQQLTPVVSVNAKTGQAAYTGVSLEPGGKVPLQVNVGSQGVQGDVSWLDVTRPMHNCRHAGIWSVDGGTPPNCQ